MPRYHLFALLLVLISINVAYVICDLIWRADDLDIEATASDLIVPNTQS